VPQQDRLGLRENPFKNNTDQRYFYADQNRSQILESTEHLIEYSSNFQVIIGEPGVGKSYLLETLANRIDNNWRVAKVNHSEQNAEQYDTLSLIQAILNAFGAIDGSYSDLLEALETQLAEINQLGFKPVLMVDNAQVLSIDSLRFLIQLSQQKQNEEPYINIVLFATDEITELLQSSELRDYREFIHIATLSLFDKEGVSGYLRHKMAVVGFDRESPFTPRIIDSIFDNSRGLPEKINFFADKFLASSGKAENYIDPTSTDQKTKADNFNLSSVQEHEDLSPAASDNLTNFPMDDELQDHRSDRAAEQLSRLAEKFEEIEQLGDQPVDASLSDQDQYNEELGSNNISAETSSALPKFIIPVAVIGLLLVAVLVINGVFEKSEQTDPQLAGEEEIELLPLELPPQRDLVLPAETSLPKTAEGSLSKTADGSLPKTAEGSLPKTEIPIVSETVVDTRLVEKEAANQESVTELEIVEVNGSDSGIKESQVPVTPDTASKTDSVTIAVPVITRIEPEPIIGANSRQYITILGNNLEKDTSLIVSWANNKKVFSAKQTPEQWQYINNNKIKLHLSTGTTSQQWQILAKNTKGAQSQRINFDVVRPFVSKMTIQRISPDPLIGSDKRQAVTINGQGFSMQTVIELKWDKNKKHFSSRLTPGQFEYISANQIKLYIATGKKERKWRILATNPTGSTSSSSFSVVKERPKKTSTASLHNGDTLKGENWLRQQPDTNYTIQLFASHNKQAINELLNKYALKGDILRFNTQKEGKNWYTMTYGSYVTKQDAIKAIASLNAELTNPAPWVRSMASIKETLLSGSKQPGKKTLATIPQKSRDEAWIWTQNPADYTVQLIALSSKQAIKDYIKQYSIQSEAVYFKTTRSGKALYVLLYGKYTDKKLATQAAEKLSVKIKNGKPWVRSFSAVHEMMSSR